MRNEHENSVISWADVRTHFNQCQGQNLQHAIASVDQHGHPVITPIGTIFLNGNKTAFYFERYASTLPLNALAHPKVVILAVKTSKWYWLKSLFNGYFKGTPAIKLYGELGVRRRATKIELERLSRRLDGAKWLKGYKLLWDHLEEVREINIQSVKIVEFHGKMEVRM